MKLLMVCNPNSIWIKYYIEFVLKNYDFEVTLLAKEYTSKWIFEEFYKNNRIEIENCVSSIGFLNKIPKLRGLISLLKGKRYIAKQALDCIHIQGMFERRFIAMIGSLRKSQYRKLIITYWGTDLLGATDEQIASDKKLLTQAEYITLGSSTVCKKFEEIFQNKFREKSVDIKFGASGFDMINSLFQSHYCKEQCKIDTGLNCDKIAIMVGYNGVRRQNHLKVIEALRNLPNQYQCRLQVVLQMTYGLNNGYLSEIKEILETARFEYTVLTEFMADADVAKLRLASDIFVHSATTDGFSATLREYLYAGAAVISPAWIDYEELHKLGIEYTIYSSFEELSDLIVKIMDKSCFARHENTDKLYQHFSWSAWAAQWRMLYE